MHVCACYMSPEYTDAMLVVMHLLEYRTTPVYLSAVTDSCTNYDLINIIYHQGWRENCRMSTAERC